MNRSFEIDSIDNPVFDRFWRHYNASQMWCRKHWVVSNNVRPVAKGSPPMLLPPPPPPPPCRCGRNRKRRSGGGKKSQKISTPDDTRPDASNNFDDKMDSTDNNVVDKQEDTEECTEVDPDFVEFLMNSIKHRLERDKAKNAGGQNSWFSTLDEYIPIDKIGVNRRAVSLAESILPPTEAQGEERKRDMQTLYGAKAERIQALESLMQMQFDVDFDKLNPPLWPNMPFKL